MYRGGPLTYQYYLPSFPIPDPELLVYYQDDNMVLNYIDSHVCYLI